jgi:uncharacterized protein (TIGR03067 family)
MVSLFAEEVLMTTRVVLPCLVFLLIAAVAPAQDAKKELEKLQGEWTMVSLEENGMKVADETAKQYKLTVKENQWIVTRSGKEGFAKVTFKIDPTKDPKTIDLTYKTGDKESVSQGIYKLAGDTLTLCRTDSKAERPKQFKIRDKLDTLVVWKRVKK